MYGLISKDGVGGVRTSHSSFVPNRKMAKTEVIIITYTTVPEIFAERIRIQNLRFAYFLCAAQFVSRRD
jgi:hypothetical protein